MWQIADASHSSSTDGWMGTRRAVVDAMVAEAVATVETVAVAMAMVAVRAMVAAMALAVVATATATTKQRRRRTEWADCLPECHRNSTSACTCQRTCCR